MFHIAVPAEILDDEEGDIWQVAQTPYREADSKLHASERRYGFNRSKTGVMGRMLEHLPNCVDIRLVERCRLPAA